MYDPCKLSQVIFNAVISLKYKIIDKIPQLNFTLYVKDRYEFDLEFHLPKFPPLQTCEHGLSF